MSKHEIVRQMTSGQLKDLAGALIGTIPSNLTVQEAQLVIGAKSVLHDLIRGAFRQVIRTEMHDMAKRGCFMELIKLRDFEKVARSIVFGLFPKPDRIWSHYKLFRFDEDQPAKAKISLPEVRREMAFAHYKPANTYEFLLWRESWGEEIVFALGAYTNGHVLGLARRNNLGRELALFPASEGFPRDAGFLGVRE